MDYGLIKYLHKKYSKSITKETIARGLGIGTRHLDNCFKSRQELYEPQKPALSKVFRNVAVNDIKRYTKQFTEKIYAQVPCSNIVIRFITNNSELLLIEGTVLKFDSKGIKHGGYKMETDLKNKDRNKSRASSLVLAQQGYSIGIVNSAGIDIKNHSIKKNTISLFKNNEKLHSLLHIIIYLKTVSINNLPVPSLLITCENRRKSEAPNNIIRVFNNQNEEYIKYKKIRKKNGIPVIFSFRDIQVINDIAFNTLQKSYNDFQSLLQKYYLLQKNDSQKEELEKCFQGLQRNDFQLLLRIMGYLPFT